MKKYVIYLMIAMAAICLAVISCEQTDIQQGTPKFKQNTITVEPEGGITTVEYTIEGDSSDDADINACCGEGSEWIYDITAKDGNLTFSTEANDSNNERSGIIIISLKQHSDSITVIQSPSLTEEISFNIVVKNISSDKAYVDITPSDNDVTYVAGTILVSEMNSWPDDNKFIDLYLIPQYEKAASESGMTVKEYMEQILMNGKMESVELDNLSAESEYYAFCVGMSPELKQLSDLSKINFSTPDADAFNAQLDVVVTGPDAKVTITPSDETKGYYATTVQGHSLTDKEIINAVQTEIEATVVQNAFWGISRQDIVIALTSYGKNEFIFNTLKALTPYTAVALEIDADGYVTSNPAYKEFTTDETITSGNIISVEYTNITGRRADFSVIPSDPEAPYVFFAYEYTEDLKSKSDEEIINFICTTKNMDFYTRRGNVESYEENLKPLTEYVIYSFGYSGGNASTELFVSTFTTNDNIQNQYKLEFQYGPYYNGDELSLKYPQDLGDAAGKCVFPVSYEIKGSDTDIFDTFYTIYLGDLTDKEKYPEEALYQDVRKNGNTSFYRQALFLVNFDEVYTLCGFIETDDGRFSELCRQKVGPFTLEGCSPEEEFDDPTLN